MKLPKPFLYIASMCAAVELTMWVSAFAATSDESANVASAVQAFHDALAQCDGKAAMKLLTPDAAILESGSAETRAEYESHHLGEDMQFAQAVQSTRANVQVQIDGNAAWLTSRSRSEGSFQGKPINTTAVELVVLTKTIDGWRIRAIHWSSRRNSSG
jgi:ketosteroid isomerase-like protein